MFINTLRTLRFQARKWAIADRMGDGGVDQLEADTGIRRLDGFNPGGNRLREGDIAGAFCAQNIETHHGDAIKSRKGSGSAIVSVMSPKSSSRGGIPLLVAIYLGLR